MSKGLSLTELGQRVNYSKGHLSHVELGRKRPTSALAASCDDVLDTGGILARQLQREDFPARVRSRPRPLAQLPHPPVHFTGRQEHLGLLDRLLSDSEHGSAPRTVVVSGAPGTGKTALALQWASRAAHRFGDGTLYADLGGPAGNKLPAVVLEGFLLALGLDRDAIPGGLSERAASYRNILASRQLLIVLDNVASSQQVRPLMTGSASNSLVVMTSRLRLSGLALHEGAHSLVLDALRLDEAAEYLRSASARTTADVRPSRIARIARLCEGLPLALTAMVHHLDTPSDGGPILADPRESVRGRLDLLSVFGDELLSVRRALEESYCALPPLMARAVRVLGVCHPDGVDDTVAARSLGVTTSVARNLLAGLAEANLLAPLADGGYRWSPLMTAFAAELVDVP